MKSVHFCVILKSKIDLFNVDLTDFVYLLRLLFNLESCKNDLYN
jgi:hypothetical protein